MFNILIVDDNMQKIQDIIDELELLENSKEITIDYELEVKKAYNVLEQKHFDLLILDVQLPSLDNRYGISKDGGIGLLNIINEVDRVKKPNFIIGLTAFDENYQENFREFQNYLCVLVKYDRTEKNWRKQIAQKVGYLIKAKQEVLIQDRLEHLECQFDCAIITAVKTEMQSVLNCGLTWLPLILDGDSTIYYQAVYNKDEQEIKLILAQQHQMGMVAASILSGKMISKFNPKLICMLGIAAGRKGEVDLGDIIAISECWDYGSGKIKSDINGDGYILEPEPHHIPIEASIKEYLMGNFESILYEIRKEWNASNGNRQGKDIKLHVGALASGAAVIQDENIVTNFILPQNRKVLGVDMETYAVYYSACNVQKKKPAYISIKTVCDFANQYKNDSYQNYSAFVSTKFFMYVLSELLHRI